MHMWACCDVSGETLEEKQQRRLRDAQSKAAKRQNESIEEQQQKRQKEG